MKLNMVLDEEESEKLNRLRKFYGIKQGTELVRFLITRAAKEISKED